MKATVSWEDNKMEFCRNAIATGGKLNSEQSRYLVTRLEATEHALEFALKRIEKISAERIKEIEAHRQTTLKLVKLQNPHASQRSAPEQGNHV